MGPEGDTMEKKLVHNAFLGLNMDSPKSVAIRIARVNHSCQPNAGSIYDETARVAILFAQKDIQPDEEICICYYSPFHSTYIPPEVCLHPPEMSLEEEFAVIKNELLSLHGITCPADCSCNDPVIRDLVHETRQIYYSTIVELANQRKIEEALAAGDELLDIHRRLNISWAHRGTVDFFLFQIAVSMSKLLPRAKEYIRSAVELFSNICPYSKRHTEKYKKLLEQPETNPNYLANDQVIYII